MPRSNLSYLRNAVLTVVGIPVAMMTGLTGISSAPLLTPLLTWLVGAGPAASAGVVLTAVSFAAWCSLLSFAQAGDVSWVTGILVLAGSFIGAAAAAKAAIKNPIGYLRNRPFWTFVPILFGVIMIVEPFDPRYKLVLAHMILPSVGIVLPLIWSLAIGFVSGYVGQNSESGGLLVVPLLLLLLGRPILQAEATAILVLLLASLPSVLIHALKREIDAPTALALSFGGVFGALYGSHTAVSTLSAPLLSTVTGSVIAACAGTTLFRRPPTATATESDEKII